MHRYWTFQQMVAHHTCGGCNLRPGDMLGCGTISGPEPHERACLLELTQGGKDPLQLVPGAAGTAAAAAAACAGAADGQQQQRAYLLDGDEVVIRGWCVRDGVDKVGFGECRGRLLPARPV
jgi:fumarylacetoacetase